MAHFRLYKSGYLNGNRMHMGCSMATCTICLCLSLSPHIRCIKAARLFYLSLHQRFGEYYQSSCL
uniref:Uncharacterized protein n=1 Tax=Aegilops tauschii subsp. strangulata TaxID=200361 RepID=A0A453JYQ3_AEGTS